MIKRSIRLLFRVWYKVKIIFYSDYTVSKFYRNKMGVQIGDNCRILDKRINLFGSEPYLIKIGNNVTITEGVRLVTHDGGAVLFRNEYPGLNIYGGIQIHDNCFIGTAAIIMPNVEIGPDAVVGAGAVVTKDVPRNSVVAGVPAKVLSTLDSYKESTLAKGMIIHSVNAKKRREEIIFGLDENLKLK